MVFDERDLKNSLKKELLSLRNIELKNNVLTLKESLKLFGLFID